MIQLNKVLHQELRLAIISYLNALEWVNFNELLTTTGASKGNISVQISKLQSAGYVEIRKSFKNNYPLTEYKITTKGQEALEQYVQELKTLLKI